MRGTVVRGESYNRITRYRISTDSVLVPKLAIAISGSLMPEYRPDVFAIRNLGSSAIQGLKTSLEILELSNWLQKVINNYSLE